MRGWLGCFYIFQFRWLLEFTKGLVLSNLYGEGGVHSGVFVRVAGCDLVRRSEISNRNEVYSVRYIN